MRIIYVGSVIFSAKALGKLIAIGADICGVVTKKESAFNSDFCDLGLIAEKHGIPFQYITNINSPETVSWMRDRNPDIIFCFGWSNLIKKEVLELAPMGVVGFHPSLLPDNKGRHPLIWAKVLGLPETGSTFFFMDEGADTGDILSQQAFPIGFDDDAQILYDRMTETALAQIGIFHEQLKAGNYPKKVQDKAAGNNWRKRSMRDGAIDFRMTTEGICNLVRALTKPYVGAHIDYNGGAVSVWKVQPGETAAGNLEPGKILAHSGKQLLVKTANGAIWIADHEFTDLPGIGTYL